MVQSKAPTVAAYLKSLPTERRAVIAAVRKAIRSKLPKGYQESMNWGMISYEIPLKRFPDTYNGQPLMYMALAAQKNNYALYTMGAYSDPKVLAWLKSEFKRAGKRLDMGKSCIRFKTMEDLPVGVAAGLAGQLTVDEYLRRYAAAKRKK